MLILDMLGFQLGLSRSLLIAHQIKSSCELERSLSSDMARIDAHSRKHSTKESSCSKQQGNVSLVISCETFGYFKGNGIPYISYDSDEVGVKTRARGRKTDRQTGP